MAETVRGVSEDVCACHRSLEDEGRVLVGHVRRARIAAFRERTVQLCSLTANRPQTDSVVLRGGAWGTRIGRVALAACGAQPGGPG